MGVVSLEYNILCDNGMKVPLFAGMQQLNASIGRDARYRYRRFTVAVVSFRHLGVSSRLHY